MTEDERTPWQIDRDRIEDTGAWPDPAWGPFHRHTFSGEIHRDGGAECNQPGTPRRVYVFDPAELDEHERIVARWAAQHPDQFLPGGGHIHDNDSTVDGCPGCFPGPVAELPSWDESTTAGPFPFLPEDRPQRTRAVRTGSDDGPARSVGKHSDAVPGKPETRPPGQCGDH